MTKPGTSAGDGSGPKPRYHLLTTDGGILADQPGKMAGPFRPSRREEIVAHTGQNLYPAIEFENGVWYREESRDMAKTIRAGTLMDRATDATRPEVVRPPGA